MVVGDAEVVTCETVLVAAGATVGKPEDLDLFGLSQPARVASNAITSKVMRPTFTQHRHRLPFLPFMIPSFFTFYTFWQETSQTPPYPGKSTPCDDQHLDYNT